MLLYFTKTWRFPTCNSLSRAANSPLGFPSNIGLYHHTSGVRKYCGWDKVADFNGYVRE